MNSLEAHIRDNPTKGQLNSLRNEGKVPAIIYGGKDQYQKIKKHFSEGYPKVEICIQKQLAKCFLVSIVPRVLDFLSLHLDFL